MLIGIFLLTVAATWTGYAFYHLYSGRRELYSGNLEKAYNHFLAASSTGLFQQKTRAGLAVLEILQGGTSDDPGMFGKTDRSALEFYNHTKLIEWLIQNSKYKKAYNYSRILLQIHPSPEADYYAGLAATALGKYEEAADLFLALSEDNRYHMKAEEKLTLLEKIADDEFYSIRDRNGDRIAKSFSSADINGGASDYLPYVIPLVQVKEQDIYNSVFLTIDNRIQRITEKTVEDLSGILVALSPSSGDILAVTANGDCLTDEFYLKKLQPGFLVNILTTVAAAETKNDAISFPYGCPPEKKYEDIIIYGGDKKQPISNIRDALINECNVYFSECALKIGNERLAETAKRFCFGRSIEIGGKNIEVAVAEIEGNPSSLALFTGGYHGIWTTPLHLAIIASALGSDGAIYRPRLVLNKKNIDGNSYFKEEPKILNITAEESTLNLIRNIMSENGRKIVADSKSNAEGLRFGALYTYSGGVEAPFAWILIGFYPSDNPKIAFSLILTDDSASKENVLSRAIYFLSQLDRNKILQ